MSKKRHCVWVDQDLYDEWVDYKGKLEEKTGSVSFSNAIRCWAKMIDKPKLPVLFVNLNGPGKKRKIGLVDVQFEGELSKVFGDRGLTLDYVFS